MLMYIVYTLYTLYKSILVFSAGVTANMICFKKSENEIYLIFSKIFVELSVFFLFFCHNVALKI